MDFACAFLARKQENGKSERFDRTLSRGPTWLRRVRKKNNRPNPGWVVAEDNRLAFRVERDRIDAAFLYRLYFSSKKHYIRPMTNIAEDFRPIVLFREKLIVPFRAYHEKTRV